MRPMTIAFTLVAAATLFALLAAPDALAPRLARAQAQPIWEPRGLTDPVYRLFTPASGAFLATTSQGLVRSDNAGRSWRPLSLPPAAGAVAVDPTNHDVLYATGAEGLYRSADGGATWTVRLTYAQVDPTAADPAHQPWRWAIAVSPAYNNLVYAVAYQSWPGTAPLRLLRSPDGGRTWQPIRTTGPASIGCGWEVFMLVPHPTDNGRAFASLACSGGRDFGASLEQSRDQGLTWATWAEGAQPADGAAMGAGYPRALVGGQGAMPRRWYLATNRDDRLGGASVFRTDDDGATWSEVLAFRGGGNPQYPYADDPGAPRVSATALAYDPAHPDRVFAGTGVQPGDADHPVQTAGVKFSLDAGGTWQDLGQDIGTVNDLALGVDGHNLYAATEAGLWRMQMDEGGPVGVLPAQPAPPADQPPAEGDQG